MTDRYCVMGHPVAHSQSPWIHGRFAELTGQDMTYDRRLIPLDGFADGVRTFAAEGGLGCNITVPFKFQAAEVAGHISERAALAQASNILSMRPDGIHADNTDGAGLVADITRHAGVDLAGRDLLLLGAGGASAGVLGPLLHQRPRRLVVANRTVDKAQALVARHARLAQAMGVDMQACAPDAVHGRFHVVVNGTASSLGGAGVPVAGAVLDPGALALDMMYGPPAAGFMTWAAEHGAHGRDGLGMLVEQAAEAFFIWRGVRPPTAAVLTGLRERLAAL